MQRVLNIVPVASNLHYIKIILTSFVYCFACANSKLRDKSAILDSSNKVCYHFCCLDNFHSKEVIWKNFFVICVVAVADKLLNFWRFMVISAYRQYHLNVIYWLFPSILFQNSFPFLWTKLIVLIMSCYVEYWLVINLVR